MPSNIKTISWNLAIVFFWLITFLFCGQAMGAKLTPVPPPSYVADTASLFTAQQKEALLNKLEAFAKKTGSQVAVVTVPSLNGEPIESFAHRVGVEWKPGRKGIGDGLIIVLAPKERQVRIDVMRDLEGAIPDVSANKVIQKDIIPNVAKGNYYEGIDKGLDSIFKLIENENLPPPEPIKGKGGGFLSSDFSNDFDEDVFQFSESLLVLVFMGLGIAATFRQLFGTKAAPVSAFFIGLVGWLIFGSIIGAVIIGLISLLFGLFVPNRMLEAGARRAAQLNQMGRFGTRSRYKDPFGGLGGLGGFGGFGRGGSSRSIPRNPFSGGGRSAGGGASGRW